MLGLPSLVEVYGSTETAGVGSRMAPDTAFTLLDHLVPYEGDDDVLALCRRRPQANSAP